MSSLTDFVVHGKIGPLFLGQSKQNILEILGEPKSWVGKPPCFGEPFESYKQSDVWHYYEQLVFVHFGEDETVEEIGLFVENIEGPLELFAGWPQMHGITMERWRLALKEHNLPATESMEDLNFWILSGLTCVALCAPYPGGKVMPRWRRPVVMIQKVADPNLISHLTAPSEESPSLVSLLDPLIGSSDDDVEVARYATLDPNNEEAVKAVIRERLIPSFQKLPGESQVALISEMGRRLEVPTADFEGLFYGALLPFAAPKGHAKLFFVWLFDEMRKVE